MLDCVNVCAAQNSQGVVQEILFKKQHWKHSRNLALQLVQLVIKVNLFMSNLTDCICFIINITLRKQLKSKGD